jgi:hypothetical protein
MSDRLKKPLKIRKKPYKKRLKNKFSFNFYPQNPYFSSINTHMKNIIALGTVCLSLLAVFNAHAAVRCTNAAGAVAYADTAAACPAGYSQKGEVAAMPPVAAKDQALAQHQAANDKKAADALDKQRIKDERATAKAQLAAQKGGASKAKQCKTAELALKRAKDKYDDAPSASSKSKKSSKASKKDGGQTHVVMREGDDKASKAKKKARHSVDNAQAKRDLACA